MLAFRIMKGPNRSFASGLGWLAVGLIASCSGASRRAASTGTADGSLADAAESTSPPADATQEPSAVADATTAFDGDTVDRAGSDATVPDGGAGEADVGGNEAGICGAAALSALDAAPPATCSSMVWSQVPGSPAGTVIRGSGPGDIWLIHASPLPWQTPVATPQQATLMRGDGKTWAPVDACPQSGTPGAPSAIWVGGPNDVLIGGCSWGDEGAVVHWDGCRWSPYSTKDYRWAKTFWSYGPREVWGTDNNSPYLGYWDGTSWIKVDSTHAGPLAGGAPGDFWLVDNTILVHRSPQKPDVSFDLGLLGYDASACPSYACFDAIWASATDDLWVAGANGQTVHFDGSTWSHVATPTLSALRALSGTSRSDVWAVGAQGALLHFDGGAWSAVAVPTNQDLFGVWADGPCDVWAIGDAVYHGAGQ